MEFNLFGLELLELNVLITDVLLGLLSLLFAYRIYDLRISIPFFRNWYLFLLTFGAAAFLGGLGHAFFNYAGVSGKIPGWVLGIFSVYFIETAMISVYPGKKWKRIYSSLSQAKLIFVILILILFQSGGNPAGNIDRSILLVIINSFAGVIISTGLFGWYYYRQGFTGSFLTLVMGVLVMIPSSAVFLLDISPFHWFDRNDLSHLILGIGISLFFLGVKRIISQYLEIETDVFRPEAQSLLKMPQWRPPRVG